MEVKDTIFKLDEKLTEILQKLTDKLKYKSIEETIRKSFTFMVLLDEIEESDCDLYFRDKNGTEHRISFYKDLSDEATEAVSTKPKAKARKPRARKPKAN